MLVLSRKVDQRIHIGDNIEVVVLSIDGDHVKLGIQAPRQIPVLRHELLQDVQDENRQAAAAASAPIAPAAALEGLTGIRRLAGGSPGRPAPVVPPAMPPQAPQVSTPVPLPNDRRT